MVGKRGGFNRGGGRYYNSNTSNNYGNRNSSGSGYGNRTPMGQGYGNGYGGYQEQVSPWGTSAPVQENNQQQLNAMAVELEMMKRKRQMLQEQRQLLEEQRQLELLQNHGGNNRWSDGMQYGNKRDSYLDMYPRESQRRAPKRPGPPLRYPAKRPALETPAKEAPRVQPAKTRPVKKPAPKSEMVSQVEKDIGPVELPTVDNVFRGPESMNPTVRGRLEYTLGQICRKLRETYLAEPYKMVLSVHQLKLLKAEIRDRLQAVMMNKPVESWDQVTGLYRKVHSEEDDLTVLQGIVAKTGREPAVRADVKEESSETTEGASDEQGQRNRRKRPSDQKAELSRLMRINLHHMLQGKMDAIFAEMKKLVDEKGSEIFTSATKEEKPDEPENQKAITDVENIKEEVVEIKDDEPANDKQEEKKKREEETDLAIKELVEDKIAVGEAYKKLEPYIQQHLNWKLPDLLARYKDHIIHLLTQDPQMQELGLKTVESLPEEAKNKLNVKLYFVKLMGRPSLPHRDQTTRFLRDYNVITIKRHHSVHNLLFVGVPSLELANKLVANDGIRIAGKKLSLRASDRMLKDAENPSGDADESAVKTEDGEKQENGERQENGEKKEEKETGGTANVDIEKDIDELISSIDDVEELQDKEAAQEPVVVVDDEQSDVKLLAEDAESKTETEAAGIKTRRSTRRAVN